LKVEGLKSVGKLVPSLSSKGLLWRRGVVQRTPLEGEVQDSKFQDEGLNIVSLFGN